MGEPLDEAEEVESEADLGEAEQHTQGTQTQGTQAQGTQGTALDGTTFSGAIFNGKIPTGYQLGKAKVTSGGGWYFPNATAIVNSSTQTTITPITATPFYLTGVVRPTPGVPLSPPSASGDTVNLMITNRKTDGTMNAFAPPGVNPYATSTGHVNSDVTLYKVLWQNGSTWESVCPNGGEGIDGSNTGTGTGWAVFIRGTYDATATASELTTGNTVPGPGAEFTIACTNGVVSKCARQWGYKPWKTAPNHINGAHHDLRPFHQMCLRAARADYCSDGSSFTTDGTLVDIADSKGFVIREPEQSTFVSFYAEARFAVNVNPGGQYFCLGAPRHEEIAQTATCSALNLAPLGSCSPQYGRSNDTRNPANLQYNHLWVGSQPYCPHKTNEEGVALQEDCNYCTRRVCTQGDYAGALRGATPGPSSTTGDQHCCAVEWDAQCVSEAAAWCTPSAWSNRKEITSYESGSLAADWYGPDKYDFVSTPKDYGPIGTAPFGTPSGFPSNTGARWIGSEPPTQATGYFRFRFRNWLSGSKTAYMAANGAFELYVDGTLLGSGATPGTTYTYPFTTAYGKEYVVAVKVDKPGGGNAFLFDIR